MFNGAEAKAPSCDCSNRKCKPNKPMPITLEGVALQLYEYPATSPS